MSLDELGRSEIISEDTSKEECETELTTGGCMEDSLVIVKEECRKFEAEIELCRQEVHGLRRKLELHNELFKDLQKANELLERTHTAYQLEKEKTLQDTEKKYFESYEQYQSRIIACELDLKQKEKENEELHAKLKHYKEIASTSVQEPSTICYDDIQVLEKNIKEQSQALQEETEKWELAEAMLEQLKCEHAELQSVKAAIQGQIAEKSEALENVNAELTILRTKLNAPQTYSDTDLGKGKSLFAEVEDKRKEAIDKYVLLKEKVTEARKIAMTQMNESRLLRIKYVPMLRQLERDSANNKSDGKELINKYKSRISELEDKIEVEIGKSSSSQEAQLDNTTYDYFQCLLARKKKEIGELRIKIENLSTQLLNEEEAKHNIAKELVYWKTKTLSRKAAALLADAEAQSNVVKESKEIINKEILNNKDNVVYATHSES